MRWLKKRKEPAALSASKAVDVESMKAARDVEALINVVRNKIGGVDARGEAMRALGDLGDARAVDALAESLESGVRILRGLTAMLTEARDAPAPDLDQVLIAMAMAGELAIRTAEALGKIGGAQAIAALSTLVKDEALAEAAEPLPPPVGSASNLDVMARTVKSQIAELRDRAAQGVGPTDDEAEQVPGPSEDRPRAISNHGYLVLLWDRAPWTEAEQQEIGRAKQAELESPVSILKSVQVQGAMPSGPNDVFVVATALLACKEAGVTFENGRDQIVYQAGQKGPGLRLGVITIVVNSPGTGGQQERVATETPTASAERSGGVRAAEAKDVINALMTRATPCRRCGTTIVFEEGGLLAMDRGIRDQVVMCKRCHAIYEVHLTPRALELLDDVTSRYG